MRGFSIYPYLTIPKPFISHIRATKAITTIIKVITTIKAITYNTTHIRNTKPITLIKNTYSNYSKI